MLKAAIVGLPVVGKTTIFNLLTGAGAHTAGFSGQRENIGTARIPDDRLDWLADLYHPRKLTPATIEFRDLPGLQPGASAHLLSEIREVDALVQVVRLFPGDPPPVTGVLDPVRELESLELELLLSDLTVLEKRLTRLRDTRKLTSLQQAELALLEICVPALQEGRSVHSLELDDEAGALLRNFGLLTEKPLLLVVNLSEADFRRGDYPHREALEKAAAARGLPLVRISGRIEEEIAELPPEDRAVFLEDLGETETGISRLGRATYERLGLISFLTAGEDEVRAWTIRRGTRAKEAAGKIHSDLERGFIRAEVVAFDALRDAGNMVKARERGLVRLEGRDYTVQDGDVINFRFNVRKG